MPLQRAERPVFSFNKGFNSDAPVVTFPADFSIEEINFELLLDGTRRRRRGLEDESSGVVLDTTQPTDAAVRTFKWRSVGENPDLNFHIVQIGNMLHFMDDEEVPSEHVRNFTFDLTTIAVEGHTDEQHDKVDMAFGRGQALIVGKYLEPAYLTYDATHDTISSFPIQIRERDFKDQIDSVDNVTQPTELSDAYQYNLLNRGWTPDNIDLFHDTQHKYPAKNMLQWLGYRRQIVSGYTEQDGTKEFSPDKLVAELFQDAPAPRGHLIKNPFNTALPFDISDEFQGAFSVPYSNADPATNMSGWTPKDPTDLNLPAFGNPKTNQVTAELGALHGLSAGDNITVTSSVPGLIGGAHPPNSTRDWSFDGSYVLDSVTDTSVTFTFTLLDDAQGYDSSWGARGGYPTWPFVTISGSPSLTISGSTVDERPTVCAFFAGRAVFGGIPNSELGSALYFSQVIEQEDQYGKCYQVADPTSETLSDLVPTDGIVLRIPEFGRLYCLYPYGSSLLAYASGGVWQIGPGASGYFTATSYSVRKLSDVQCTNGTAVVDAEGTPLFAANSGIFSIQQDPQAGFLFVQSITQGQIDTWYAQLGEATRSTFTATFDAVNKRALWLYRTAEGEEDRVLVFDLKFKAFTLWAFVCEVSDLFTVTELGSTRSILRYISRTDAGFSVSTATSTTYTDYGNAYITYIAAGFDTAQAPTRRKQTPMITVFSYRTEIVEDSEVTNTSSILLSAYWDWSDTYNSTIGYTPPTQQVYRKARWFVPDQGNGDLQDGYPVVITRNKVRGRGRALQLYFECEDGMDAHILGWSINFDVLTSN